jgi:DNA-binding SARP family transcriptional activator
MAVQLGLKRASGNPELHVLFAAEKNLIREKSLVMDESGKRDRLPAAQPVFRIWLCGAFRVERRIGTTYELVRTPDWGGSSYPRLLLKALLCCPGRQARREALIDLLWPETDPEQAAQYFNTATTKLRRVLQPMKGQENLLFTGDDATVYRLDGQHRLWVDVDEALTLLKEAEVLGRTAGEALPLLEEAAGYFHQGAFLQEEEGLWVTGRRATLERTRYRCRLWLAEVYIQQGRNGQAEMVLNALLEEDPTDEDVLCRLMLLLHRQDMVHQALKLYEDACKTFSSEGLELSEATKALAVQLQANRRYSLSTPDSFPSSHSVALPFTQGGTEETTLLPFTPAVQGLFCAATDSGKDEIPMTDLFRRDLARFLSLSPFIAIAPAPVLELLAHSGYAVRMNTLDAEMSAAYEEDLKLSWQLYYSASAQTAASTIHGRIHHLSSLLEYASGQARRSLLAFKCRFLQLDAVIAKDQLDLARSLAQSKESLALATYLDDGELLAAALFRRARTYLWMQNYDLAIQDLEYALPFARRSRDPLKSYIYICLAEAYSLRSPDDLQVRSAALALLDAVGEALRTSNGGQMDGDGSYTRVDVPGWSMERANVLGRFGYVDQAREALNDARKELGPAWTRWQGNLEIADAGLALLENDVERCCTRLLNAAMIVRSTSSKSNASKIQNIYAQVTVEYPTEGRVQELSTQLGVPLLTA